jgi:hypothetical protein
VLESMDMRGRFTVHLTDGAGQVVHRQVRSNHIVKSGRRLVAELFGGVATGTPPTQVSHVAVGTNGAPPSDDDGSLKAQRGDPNPITEVAYTDFDEPIPSTTDVVKRTRVSVTAVFDFDQANGSAPLREAGLLTAATGGVLYNRVVFQPVTKTDAFKLTVLWDIVF